MKNQPFFLFLHTYRTHQPYRPPLDLLPSLLEDYAGVYANRARAAAWLTQEQVMRRSPQQNKIGRELSGTRAADDTDRAFFRRLYDAAATGADREIGDILGMLRKVGSTTTRSSRSPRTTARPSSSTRSIPTIRPTTSASAFP